MGKTKISTPSYPGRVCPELRQTRLAQTLIAAYVGMSIRLNDMNTRCLLGQEVNLSDLTQASSTLTRLAVRIGIVRKVRDKGPTLSDYLREHDQP